MKLFRYSRNLRFNLASLLVAMTAFCLWLGWKVHAIQEERRAVAWVQEMGGSVRYHYEVDEAQNKIIQNPQPRLR